jgi:hypothetical protein
MNKIDKDVKTLMNELYDCEHHSFCTWRANPYIETHKWIIEVEFKHRARMKDVVATLRKYKCVRQVFHKNREIFIYLK